MEGKPLPIEFDPLIHIDAARIDLIKQAYAMTHLAQNHFSNHKEKLVNVRVVGYLMLYGPSEDAIGRVATEVNSIDSTSNERYEGICSIGDIYQNGLIRACEFFLLFIFEALMPLTVKRNKSHLSSPFSHPSRPSFDIETNEKSELIATYNNDPSLYNTRSVVSVAPHATFSFLICPLKGFWSRQAPVPCHREIRLQIYCALATY